MNTLLRLKHDGPLNDYKPVSGAKLDELFVAASNANLEIEKFYAVLNGHPWPPELRSLRSNILSTSILDRSITMNAGNSTTVLPELVDTYRRACPNLAEMKLYKWKQSHFLSSKDQSSQISVPVSSQSSSKIEPAPVPGPQSENNAHHSKGTCFPDTATLHEEKQEELLAALIDAGITALNSSWRQYETETLNPND